MRLKRRGALANSRSTGMGHRTTSLIAVVLFTASCTERSADRVTDPAFELVDPHNASTPA
jgi:hypothetical protein